MPPDAPAAPLVSPRVNPRRLIIFASIISSILLFANAVVCATVSAFFNIPGWLLWQLIPGLVALTFIATTMVGWNHSSLPLRLVYAFTASWLGALNFAFFASIACGVLSGLSWLVGHAIPPFQLATTLFSIAALTTIYGLINATWLRVTRITVILPNLPEIWRGRNVALITDLHLGHLSGPRFVRKITDLLRKLKPDAVFISGDMFDGTTAGLARLVEPWNQYSAPRGVFYVTGNHEEFGDRHIYLEAVQPTGLRVLNNEMISLDGLQLVGVHDGEAKDPVALRSILRNAKIDPAVPSILLAHQPLNLAVAAEEGISLQLSGHTHHGQIIPWSWLVSRIYGRFAYGLSRMGNLQVYTSSGTGTWGPPLRVGTRSEIVLIRLERDWST